MPAPFDIHLDTRELVQWSAALRTFADRDAKQVIARTLNYVGNRARTAVTRKLAGLTGLSYGDTKDMLHTYGARPSALAYEISARGGHMTLARFQPRQTPAGVSARPWGQRRMFRGSFIVEKLPPKAFHRYGAKVIWGNEHYPRQKIKPLYGPSLPDEMWKEGGETAAGVVRARLPEQFWKEMTYALKRSMGRF